MFHDSRKSYRSMDALIDVVEVKQTVNRATRVIQDGLSYNDTR